MTADFDVRVLLGTHFDPWLHSYFLTGLVDLNREGAIRLNPMTAAAARQAAAIRTPGCPLLLLDCRRVSDTAWRRICFDPLDRSDVWQTTALDEVSAYFKRSAHPPDIERLPRIQARKVYAMNPMFATWPDRAGLWSFRVQAMQTVGALRQIASRSGGPGFARRAMVRMHLLRSLATLDRYEAESNEIKRPQALFQTRLWDPDIEKGEWVSACNAERVALVRALREGLGDRYVGGLISTPYARDRYPEMLSNLTANARCRRPEFIRRCRQYLVRVNIRALFQAIPYSLGETLAANNAMVSHAVRNVCETPMRPDEHYRTFSTPEECVAQCRLLLDNPARTQAMRERAHAHYTAAVRPKEAMRRYLNLAMAR